MRQLLPRWVPNVAYHFFHPHSEKNMCLPVLLSASLMREYCLRAMFWSKSGVKHESSCVCVRNKNGFSSSTLQHLVSSTSTSVTHDHSICEVIRNLHEVRNFCTFFNFPLCRVVQHVHNYACFHFPSRKYIKCMFVCVDVCNSQSMSWCGNIPVLVSACLHWSSML